MYTHAAIYIAQISQYSLDTTEAILVSPHHSSRLTSQQPLTEIREFAKSLKQRYPDIGRMFAKILVSGRYITELDSCFSSDWRWKEQLSGKNRESFAIRRPKWARSRKSASPDIISLIKYRQLEVPSRSSTKENSTTALLRRRRRPGYYHADKDRASGRGDPLLTVT